MKVVSIASQKGGVGKTTTTISLAAGLARDKKKVLLIDIDSQANASKVLLHDYQDLRKEDTLYQVIIEREPLPIHQSSVDNLHISPSHILLANADLALTAAMDHREARLKYQLDALKNDYDYVLIDCPPSLGWLTTNALTASDKFLVTVSPGYFELDSTAQLGKTVTQIVQNYNPSLSLLGFLFTMSDATINSRSSLKILRQTYLDDVFKSVIPRNTDIRDAHYQRQDIYSFNPNATSAQAYRKLIREAFYGEEVK